MTFLCASRKCALVSLTRRLSRLCKKIRHFGVYFQQSLDQVTLPVSWLIWKTHKIEKMTPLESFNSSASLPLKKWMGKEGHDPFWLLLGILKPSNEGRASAPQRLSTSPCLTRIVFPSGESAEIELWSWL